MIETTQRHLSRSEDTQQVTLEHIRGKVDQLVELERKKQTLSIGRNQFSNKTNSSVRRSSRTERTLYLHYLSWRLPIGHLTVRAAGNSISSYWKTGEADPNEQDHGSTSYEITFIAPSWLSSSIIQLSLKAQSQQGLTDWNRNLSFGMHNYNANPLLVAYLEDGNQEGLQRLFLEGKARPTDYLPDGSTLLLVSNIPEDDFYSGERTSITHLCSLVRSYASYLGKMQY